MKLRLVILILCLTFSPVLLAKKKKTNEKVAEFFQLSPIPDGILKWEFEGGVRPSTYSKEEKSLNLFARLGPKFEVEFNGERVAVGENGSVVFELPMRNEASSHSLVFKDERGYTTDYRFTSQLIEDEKKKQVTELVWMTKSLQYFESQWYNRFRLNGIAVVIPNSGKSYSFQIGWAPHLWTLSKHTRLSALIAGGVLKYFAGSSFFHLDTALLFGLISQPWVFEVGPGVEHWIGKQGSRPAGYANVHYTLKDPLWGLVNSYFAGYTIFFGGIFKAHEFKLGAEIVF